MSLLQGLSGLCIILDALPLDSYVPVGTFTALTPMLSPSATEKQAGATYGEDVAGMVASAQVQARELIMKLTAIMNRLPAGDANIVTLQTLIIDLS